MDIPGIEVRPLKTMTGHAEFNETFFTNVRVPVDQIVGQRGQGWFVANATLGHERGMLGDPDALENRLQALIGLMQQESIGEGRAIYNAILRDLLVALPAEVPAMKLNGNFGSESCWASVCPYLSILVYACFFKKTI